MAERKSDFAAVQPVCRTVLCDGLDDAAQQLVVVDDVEEVEGKEIAIGEGPGQRECEEKLQEQSVLTASPMHSDEVERGGGESEKAVVIF